MAKKALIPEVLGKEGAGQISDNRKFEDLAQIAGQLKEEFDQYGMLEREARWRGLRIGLLCLKARPQLKHGEFLPWLDANCGHRRSHAYQCMELAGTCLRATKLDLDAIFAASAPKQLAEAKTAKVVPPATQKLFDFMGEDGLVDLFKKYHVGPGLPVGGYHAPDPNKPEKPVDWEEVCAVKDWEVLLKTLYRHALDHKTWRNLPNQKKCEAYDLITAAATEMREAVKTIRTSKH